MRQLYKYLIHVCFVIFVLTKVDFAPGFVSPTWYYRGIDSKGNVYKGQVGFIIEKGDELETQCYGVDNVALCTTQTPEYFKHCTYHGFYSVCK